MPIRQAAERMGTTTEEVEQLARAGILRVRPTPEGPLVQPASVRRAGVRVRSR